MPGTRCPRAVGGGSAASITSTTTRTPTARTGSPASAVSVVATKRSDAASTPTPFRAEVDRGGDSGFRVAVGQRLERFDFFAVVSRRGGDHPDKCAALSLDR